MSPSISIRTADPTDASLLSDIGRRAFIAAFADQNNPEDLAEYLQGAFTPQKQAAELATPGCVFLIAEDEGRPAGYARLQTGPAPTCITGQRPIELVRFYLLPEWIGSGNGSRMMEVCLRAARGRGHDVIWLSTWKKNLRGIQFYQKWGFLISGQQTFQVRSDAQEDWLLALRLEGERAA
jgi:GNAT superfamily N-acetyltransferase